MKGGRMRRRCAVPRCAALCALCGAAQPRAPLAARGCRALGARLGLLTRCAALYCLNAGESSPLWGTAAVTAARCPELAWEAGARERLQCYARSHRAFLLTAHRFHHPSPGRLSLQGLPHGTPVEFEVELVGFVHEPNWAELEPQQKLDRAARWKEQGNVLYKQARLQGGSSYGGPALRRQLLRLALRAGSRRSGAQCQRGA